MINIATELSIKLQEAFYELKYGSLIKPNTWNVMYTGHHGNDYSYNGLYKLKNLLSTKEIMMTPQELGKDIISKLHQTFFTANFDRNYIYFVIKPEYIAKHVTNIITLNNILPQTSNHDKIMVEYSSPNIAKEMHVGHLRSTIIGDSLYRLYKMSGCDVYGISHIGDYGLQFGILIQYLYEKFPEWKEKETSISSMQNFYVSAKKCMDNKKTGKEFKKRASIRVLQLQNGCDEEIVSAWEYIKKISKDAYFKIYDRLNIKLTEVGESFYQSMIPKMIKELEEKNILGVDNGRKIINVQGYKLPLTVIKSDGGYTYDTTDLAAIRYRLLDLNMKKIYYVVDSGQALHFKLIFAVARLMGWLDDSCDVRHINFGVVKGMDGKRLSSRMGGIIKLKDLLDEAEKKASVVLKTKRDDLTTDEETKIIKCISMGAIKYADLSNDRVRDYKFSYDKMLSLKGDTAPKLLYAYTRISSIIRKAGKHMNDVQIYKFSLKDPDEIKICKYLMHYPVIILKVKDTLCPHHLCKYIYKLATMFHIFFKNCRCLYYGKDKKTIIKIDYDRLLICEMVRNVMKTSFDILNIEALEKM